MWHLLPLFISLLLLLGARKKSNLGVLWVRRDQYKVSCKTVMYLKKIIDPHPIGECKG